MKTKKQTKSKNRKSNDRVERATSPNPMRVKNPSSQSRTELKDTSPSQSKGSVFNRTFTPLIDLGDVQDSKLRVPTFAILSIDGGGARGMIPAVILKEIERRSGRRISNLFDRICGTSTGAILASAISAPKSAGNSKPMFRAREVVEIYRELGEEVFSRGSFSETVIQPMEELMGRTIAWIGTHPGEAISTITAVWGKLNNPLHSAQKLAYILHSYLGDLKMKDALTELFVYAYDIGSRTPEILGSIESLIPGQARNYANFRLYQAATASSAAVPFFAPYTIWKKPADPLTVPIPTFGEDLYPEAGGSGDNYTLVDGGNGGLGNPSLFSLLEETEASAGKHKIVLSLGTGHFSQPVSPQAKSWGFVQWLGEGGELLNSIFDGEADVVDMQLRQILDKDTTYFRWQPSIPESLAFLDEGSREDMDALENVAQDFISGNDEEIDKLVEILSAPSVVRVG
ncbi:MAG: patatin-like phospholipase family protein [Maribacter sp.]|uniref:patatin-like phospholipase family protein n=1 Tax=Maribacter sp. TaxID=1897614 RepID=UPI003C78D69A